MKKQAKLIAMSLLIMLFFIGSAAHYYKLNFVDELSVYFYDYQLQLTMPNTIDERIVILDIDEKSLKEEGRWPWSRNQLALLMDKLFDKYGIAVVGFDIVFAEKDESSGIKVLKQLSERQLKNNREYQSALASISKQLDYDNLFAQSIKNRKVVLGYYFTNQQNHSLSGMLPSPTFTASEFADDPVNLFAWKGFGANLPELQQAAVAAGHFTPTIDVDGVVRRVPMLSKYNDNYYESLSIAIVRTLFGQTQMSPGFGETKSSGYMGLEWLKLDDLKIPVDAEISTFVPYRGVQGSFRYISVTDVIHDRVDITQLKDKIVLVGTTAPGLLDMRSTPVAPVFAGVEVHANMIAGILDQNLKQQPAYMQGVEVLWLFVSGILLSFFMWRLSPIQAILVASGIAAITIGASFAFWQYANFIMPVANTLIMVTLIFSLDMSYGYFIESRTKKQITNLFGQYVPNELVEEMSLHPESVSMEGDSREMTILFSDVRGFTTISEGLDPKELTMLMNEFLTPLSRVVYKYRGTIDKYMGDCIMAFWGAPLLEENHARNAIIAGLDMLSTLERLQPHFKERGWPPIHIGVGINSGRVSVGNMGSEVRVAYTVMGDEVNLASRLEGLTKQYGVGIIVGENTRNAVTDFTYRELDHVRVKGKDKPVVIYEPIGLTSELGQEKLAEIEAFHTLRRLYQAKNWEAATQYLSDLQNRFPDTKLYFIYADRIAFFKTNPPASDWDGVFTFQTK